MYAMPQTAARLEHHPAADIFPMMTGQEFIDLKSDIRTHGLLEPIVLLGGAILDGRNRYAACLELGIEPGFEEYRGDQEPTDYVVSLNLRRRHLSESQRGMVAAKLANLRVGRPSEIVEISTISQPAAAAKLNVSRETVVAARKVIDQGVPELARAVEQGEVKVSAAAQVARLPQPVQATIVANGPVAVREAARQIREAGRPEPAAVAAQVKPLPNQATFLAGEEEEPEEEEDEEEREAARVRALENGAMQAVQKVLGYVSAMRDVDGFKRIGAIWSMDARRRMIASLTNLREGIDGFIRDLEAQL